MTVQRSQKLGLLLIVVKWLGLFKPTSWLISRLPYPPSRDAGGGICSTVQAPYAGRRTSTIGLAVLTQYQMVTARWTDAL